jgi:Flp pilus assembly protein TadG
MVTAEAALVLPVLVIVLAGAVSVVTVVGAQLRVVDAAREGVRAAARGEPVVEVVAVAQHVAPDGATVVPGAPDGDLVTVTVRSSVRPLGTGLLAVTVESSATARLEPGVTADGG